MEAGRVTPENDAAQIIPRILSHVDTRIDGLAYEDVLNRLAHPGPRYDEFDKVCRIFEDEMRSRKVEGFSPLLQDEVQASLMASLVRRTSEEPDHKYRGEMMGLLAGFESPSGDMTSVINKLYAGHMQAYQADPQGPAHKVWANAYGAVGQRAEATQRCALPQTTGTVHVPPSRYKIELLYTGTDHYRDPARDIDRQERARQVQRLEALASDGLGKPARRPPTMNQRLDGLKQTAGKRVVHVAAGSAVIVGTVLGPVGAAHAESRPTGASIGRIVAAAAPNGKGLILPPSAGKGNHAVQIESVAAISSAGETAKSPEQQARDTAFAKIIHQRVSESSNAMDADRLIHIINKYDAKYHNPLVTRALVAAQDWQESRYNPKAVSPSGAEGLSQFIPPTAKAYGLHDPFNPDAAVDAQYRLMIDLAKLVQSHYPNKSESQQRDLMLAAYNAGFGAVQKYHGKVPPYSETRGYVRIIAPDADSIQKAMDKAAAAVGGHHTSPAPRPQPKPAPTPPKAPQPKQGDQGQIVLGPAIGDGGMVINAPYSPSPPADINTTPPDPNAQAPAQPPGALVIGVPTAPGTSHDNLPNYVPPGEGVIIGAPITDKGGGIVVKPDDPQPNTPPTPQSPETSVPHIATGGQLHNLMPNYRAHGGDQPAIRDYVSFDGQKFQLFSQLDARWANNAYRPPDGTPRTIATSGCAPATLAMISEHFGKNTDPAKVAAYLLSDPAYRDNGGTTRAGDMSYLKSRGLNADIVSTADTASIQQIIKDGGMVLLGGTGDMKKTPFTAHGHVIAIAHNAANGKFNIVDPMQTSTMAKDWDARTLLGAASYAVAVTKAPVGNQAPSPEKKIRTDIIVSKEGYTLPFDPKYYDQYKINTPWNGYHSRPGVHTGEDIDVSYIPVDAAKAGKVTFAGELGNTGILAVIIAHDDGKYTTYEHLSKIGVHEGQSVDIAENIGISGNSGSAKGYSTGAHLHFGVQDRAAIVGSTTPGAIHLTEDPRKYLPSEREIRKWIKAHPNA
jgi:hypothetical protein